jgi:hypothetical protein
MFNFVCIDLNSVCQNVEVNFGSGIRNYGAAKAMVAVNIV